MCLSNPSLVEEGLNKSAWNLKFSNLLTFQFVSSPPTETDKEKYFGLSSSSIADRNKQSPCKS